MMKEVKIYSRIDEDIDSISQPINKAKSFDSVEQIEVTAIGEGESALVPNPAGISRYTKVAGEMRLESDAGVSGEAVVSGKKGDKGIAGEKGEKGDTGDAGNPGVGVPVGGAVGQILAKKTDADYDTEWITAVIGGTVSPLLAYTGAGYDAISFITLTVGYL
jgi:hypothetical protein